MNRKWFQAQGLQEADDVERVKRLRDERAPDLVLLDPHPLAFLRRWQQARLPW